MYGYNYDLLYVISVMFFVKWKRNISNCKSSYRNDYCLLLVNSVDYDTWNIKSKDRH